MPAEPRVQALVLDWAGTTVDHGCVAPVGVFERLFADEGVAVERAWAREPMGTHKRDHIRAMLQMPPVAAAWAAAHGTPWTEADVERLYARATPLALETVGAFSTPIPGVVEAVAAARARGLGVAGTTGYNREMLDVVAAVAARHGYVPDVAVAASEVPAGRPAPHLCWAAATALGVDDGARAIKIGDTPVDVAAGRRAGFWSVGVALTGNIGGLTAAELAALAPSAVAALRARATETLRAAGAHLVVDSVADLDAVLAWVEARLAAGERP